MFIMNAEKTKIVNLSNVKYLSVDSISNTYNIIATFELGRTATIAEYSSRSLATKAMDRITESLKKSAKFCQLPEDRGGKKSWSYVHAKNHPLQKISQKFLAQINIKMDIMREMDGVIEEEFSNTYKKVNSEFTKVFKELFSGGNAYLKLTNEDDMLTTGIDIVASPPGKKLSSITLLSGGEKTLTAISLLFAILNVREVPFCLFDEVEAALDEANVDQFGKYLDNYKNKTQFLIITHKKKTMEYADTLYGITMQESGVSKLVSVKLNEHVDTI